MTRDATSLDPTVFRCDECGFVFEKGIADRDGGRERCPQCGLSFAREVDRFQIEDFVWAAA